MTAQTNAPEPTFDIVVTPETLTDGSVVWNVHIGNSLVLHARDEDSAEDFASGLSELVDQHTCDVAHVSIEIWKLPS